MGKILFWLKKTDPNIETPAWEFFKDVLVIFLIISIVVAVILSIRRYREAVKLFKIRSSDDVFRDFTAGRKLLWSLAWAFGIMTILGVGYYWLTFGSSVLEFVLNGLGLGCIAAVFALLLAYAVATQKASLTPRKFRYRHF